MFMLRMSVLCAHIISVRAPLFFCFISQQLVCAGELVPFSLTAYASRLQAILCVSFKTSLFSTYSSVRYKRHFVFRIYNLYTA